MTEPSIKKYCKKCKSQTPRDCRTCPSCGNSSFIIYLTLHDELKMHDSIRLKNKRPGFKQFVREIIQGWFPNEINGNTSFGVDKIRDIDQENDNYLEIVKDLKKGEIIRYCHEPYSMHTQKRKQKKP